MHFAKRGGGGGKRRSHRITLRLPRYFKVSIAVPAYRLFGVTFCSQQLNGGCSLVGTQNHGFQLVIDDTSMGYVSDHMEVVCIMRVQIAETLRNRSMALYYLY